MRNMSIRRLYTFTTISLVIIIVSLFMLVGFTVTTRSLQQTTYGQIMAEVEAMSKAIELSLSDYSHLVDAMHLYVGATFDAAFLTSPDAMDLYFENTSAYMKDAAQGLDYLASMYVTFNHEQGRRAANIPYHLLLVKEDQEWLSYPIASISDLLTQTETYDWYYEPIKQAKPVWLDPYFDPYLNAIIISYTTPLYLDNQLFGVIGMDLNLSAFSEIITDLYAYDHGYPLLLNDNYQIVYHPEYDSSMNLRDVEEGALARFITHFESQTIGTIDYTYKGVEKVIAYDHIFNGWVLGITYKKHDVLALLNKNMAILMLVGLALIVIASLISIYLAHKITQPLVAIKRFFTKVESFDLSYETEFLDLTKYQNEIGQIASSMYKIVIDQNRTVQTLKHALIAFTEITQDAKQKADDMDHFIDDQLYTLTELRKAIHDISIALESGSLTFDRLNKHLEFTLLNHQQPHDDCEQMKKSMVIQGKELQSLQRDFHAVYEEASYTTASVEEFLATVETVTDMTSRITIESKSLKKAIHQIESRSLELSRQLLKFKLD